MLKHVLYGNLQYELSINYNKKVLISTDILITQTSIDILT